MKKNILFSNRFWAWDCKFILRVMDYWFFARYRITNNGLGWGLLQLSFESGAIVDVGWYPAFETNDKFVINRIINGCWDTPESKYGMG